MNRIYLSISTEEFRGADKGRFYLSYLKIRSISKKTCGFFSFEKFIEAIGLKHRAGMLHLNALMERKMIRKVSSNRYQVIAHRKLLEGSRRGLHYTLSDELIAGLSHKEIASFRSILVELECERYKRHQRAKIKGYTIKDKRSGASDKIKNPELREMDQLMANACTAALMGIGASTASKYRTRQSLSIYKYQCRVIGMLSSTEESNGKQIDKKDYKGKIFQSGDQLLFSPISKRISSIHLKS